ncbi:T9SS type A sorting domain-containing protein [Flavobacterium sp. CS20]|uniref:T9SS type A sorting domain-containing protein n=1 Tax=Flavobacterium sp. CS20 TaxID=2775246 RepID=UPI001B3A33C6|nr:T9SS type A sorting domain-containing protein [Flavobacterium sp. CS20]QTY26147.1 T9SS type A sorting domain-containing protein [Flavobacterium sp. CS20]
MLSYSLSNVINEGNIIWSVSNGQIIGPHQGDEVSVIFDEGFTNYQVSAQLFDPNAENCLSSILTKDINLFQVDEQIVDNSTPPSAGPESYCASSLAEFSLDYQDSDTYVWTFDPPQLATVSDGIGTNNPIILFNEPFTDSSGNYINTGQIIVNAKVCGQMQEIDRFDFSLIESPTLTVNMPAEICAGTPFDVDITSDIELPGLSPQDVNINFENNFNNFNNTTINSTTSYTIQDIVLNNVDSDIAIGYNISIQSDICNDATASGTITVKPAPEADISLFSGGNTFCQAEDIDAVLQVNVQDPNGNQSFQWLFNGTIIQGETSNTIDLSNNNNGFGTYTVQVTGTNGCITTTSVYEIFKNCEDKLECEDETISVDANWINCNQVEVTATFSNNPVSVVIETSDSFSDANATFDSAQSSPGQVTYIFNVNTSGSFKFKAQANYNDCFTDSLASVDVGYHPILNTEITCNSNGNGYDVILHNDSTFLPSFNNLEANYDITNTDTGQSIVIDPSNQDFNQATATLPPGNYEFTLYIEQQGFPPCNIKVENVDLSLPDATFSISNSSPFCTEEQVVLSPTNPDPNVTYQWEFQGATNTLQDIVIQMDANPTNQITLIATNPYGCSKTFSIESLEVLKAEFGGEIKPDNPLLCQGENVNLFYEPPFGGETPSGYQWVLGGQNINGATNSTFNASTEGLYSLKLTDANGCLYEELAGVYVNNFPNPSLNIDGNTLLCEGEELEFSGTVSPSNAEYQISIVQNGQPNIVQAWTSGPDISYTETMQTAGVFEYLIEAKDNTTNCQTSETIAVNVLPSIEPQIDIQLNQCEAYSVTLKITNPQPNALYTWSNGMQGTYINVNTGGAYSVTYQPQSGRSTTANVFVPKSPDEFLWIFPEGCIDFCTETIRSEPVPYIIGPIPEFHPYSWNFNDNSVSQNGVVSDYVIIPSDGFLNLSLTNDLGCVSTSADLDIDIDGGCEASCNIEYNLESIANSNNNFISYDIIGSINNNNSFAITLSLTSYNGVYSPNPITIPANSSVSFNSSNLLTFIPDAGFTGGSDFVQVMGQQAGDAFCIHEIEIIYNNSQPRIDAKLKASPNPVTHITTLFYELLNIDKVENAEIEIYTILGYLKDQRKINNLKDEVLLDLSVYNSGQYIVVLKHGGKILNQLILIKE